MKRSKSKKMKRSLAYEAVERREALTNMFPVDFDVPTGEQAQMSYSGDDDSVGSGDDDTVGNGNDSPPGSGG